MADASKPARARKGPTQGELVPNERIEWARHDACFTPRPVARQIVTELRARYQGLIGGRILDLGAGAGSFTAEIRELLRPSLLVAVEPRESEQAHLERYADQVVIGRAQDVVDEWAAVEASCEPGEIRRFDAVIGNPPWWCWPEVWRAARRVVDQRTGLIAFLGPSTWGHSHEVSEGLDVFAELAPVSQWRLARRVAYNGGRTTDNRKCSAWVWHMGLSGRMENGWVARPLPDLGPSGYHWTVRPGTEDPCG